MDTRDKSNAKFRNKVQEILALHKSSFDHVDVMLQTVLIELQALRTSQSSQNSHLDVNLFGHRETSFAPNANKSNYSHDNTHQQLKFAFLKFNRDDPMGWSYKVE